jgi:4-hydroxy-tetrahydrodipicolinate synthase
MGDIMRPPFVDMHNRMKEVLALLGRLPPMVIHPPLVKLEGHEIERLEQLVAVAGLDRGPPGRFPRAASSPRSTSQREEPWPAARSY